LGRRRLRLASTRGLRRDASSDFASLTGPPCCRGVIAETAKSVDVPNWKEKGGRKGDVRAVGSCDLAGLSAISYTARMRSRRDLFWLAILSPVVLLLGCRAAGQMDWAEGIYDSLWAVVDDSVHKDETPYERDERMWRELRE
jgi:hypothetical protein